MDSFKHFFSKFFLVILLGTIVLISSFFYFSSQHEVAIWVWIWMLGFGATVHCKGQLHNKGMLFIFFSATVATIGRHMFQGDDYEKYLLSVEVMSQVMLIIGAGLGGNLLSQWMIHKEPS